MTTKQNCLDFLSRNLNRTSEWRRLQATKFPDDERNERASFSLYELAAQAVEIPEHIWEHLKPIFNPADGRWCDAVSQASRDVEFRRTPKTFSDYLQNILDFFSR